MRFIVSEKFLKLCLLALFSIFLLVGIFGLALSGTKQFHLNIAACSATQQGACQNPVKHVSGWQNMFNALESDAFMFSVIFAFGLLVLYKSASKNLRLLSGRFTKLHRYRYLGLSHRLFSEIYLALSSGTLQPAR